MTILDTIVAHKKQEVALACQKRPQAFYESNLSQRTPVTGLRSRLTTRDEFAFICEVKKASPSRGIIREDFDPVGQALLYAEAGAAAISVLTDEQFFKGSLDYLPQIRAKVGQPLLRKDFIIDAYQVFESAYYQADIILLIARILSGRQVTEFAQLAAKLGLEVLLEIADQEDLEKIPPAGENIILEVNNRDLTTFKVDLNNSLRIKPFLPAQFPVISASGISTAAECVILRQNGFSGALIGESLMRAASPQVLLDEFRKGLANAG